MRIMHVALGGCLKAPPVRYGVTEDTGGHIAYVLGAAMAQSARDDVEQVEIVTRAFCGDGLDPIHAQPAEIVAPGCVIRRLATGSQAYLSKEALEAEIPALTDAFLALLAGMNSLPDVIHAHFSDAAELAAAAQTLFGIPFVFSSHSLALDKHPDLNSEAQKRRVRREGQAIRRAAAIIASSRDEAERQIPAYDPTAEGRTHRIRPGVSALRNDDLRPAQRLIAPFLRYPDKPILLAIARPIRKKNLAELVRAYAADSDLQNRANLVIVAGLRDGLRVDETETAQTVAELFDLVDRHDLWGRVALPRRHDQADIASLYALAAKGGVFVNPALHEPFGLTLIEAAQAGVPVVATCNGGPGDIIDQLGYGELVDPDDTDAIGHAIRAILDDPNRDARAAEAARRADSLFSWSRWADPVGAVYADLNRAAPQPSRCHTMLASDIDGTLTGCRRGAQRFAEWYAGRDPQILFAVASGRSVTEARHVLAAWNLPEPDLFITSVGSEIWRWGEQGQLRRCKAYADFISDGWEPLAILRALGRLMLTAQPRHDQRRWKLSYFGGATDRHRIREALAEAALPAQVILSHDRLIDILPARAGKAAAIRFEARRLGLDHGQCVVAGDSGNDLDMLRAFRRAIVPANALPEVAPARLAYRSAQIHASGVLDGLRRFGLTGQNSIAAE